MWENQPEMLQEYATVTPTLERDENYLTKNCRGFQMAVMLIYVNLRLTIEGGLRSYGSRKEAK